MRAIKLTLGLAFSLALAGCKDNQPTAPATIVDMNNGADPAAANLAPVDSSATNAPVPAYAASGTAQPTRRVLGQRSEYPQTAPQSEQYQEQSTNGYAYDEYDQQVNAGQDALYADQAPPPLPQYDQPELTQANDQWTPGYWNYGTGGYYFVPGAWVAPPYSGALWTPGYWGYEGARYRFHRGFWGRHIGFYGGINYGFGYFGRGYEGGYWNNNNFYYNSRVNRINDAYVRNVYVRNVTIGSDPRYSFNGPGGYQARPVAAELAVYREQRLPPMQAQLQIREQAAGNRQQFFAENHGRPAVYAAPQRLSADAQPGRALPPRGGFGQAGVNNQAQQQQIRAQQVQQNQQRTQQAEQRTAQQQHNLQAQQEQQRNQQFQQRNAEQQQHTQQLQQHNPQQGNPQQQRVQAGQQRTPSVQQQNEQRQQQVQVQQQRTQRNEQAPQQRAQQEPRFQQQQQRGPQEQQAKQRPQQEQQRSQQAQPQQQREAPRAAPQQQAPHSAPAQSAHPQPAPQQHTEAPHGGERPRR